MSRSAPSWSPALTAAEAGQHRDKAMKKHIIYGSEEASKAPRLEKRESLLASVLPLAHDAWRLALHGLNSTKIHRLHPAARRHAFDYCIVVLLYKFCNENSCFGRLAARGRFQAPSVARTPCRGSMMTRFRHRAGHTQ